MNGRGWPINMRFIFGSAFTNACAISGPERSPAVSTKAATLVERSAMSSGCRVRM
jgi:hypothetical protein